jgi:hypothetical protein
MNLNATRAFAQTVINRLHSAGRHTEAFSLGDDLHSIGYRPESHRFQPLPSHVERVQRRAESLNPA